MRIGIDIRHLSARKHTGVEEYTYNLLSALFCLDRQDQFVLLYNSFHKKLPPEAEAWKRFPNVEIIELSWPSRLLNSSLYLLGLPRLDKLVGGVNVFFFPNITFSRVSANIPFVVTFHDLSFEMLPHLFDSYRRLWHFLVNPRQMAQKASAVLTVSHSTAEDLKKIYRLDSQKIFPVYLGLDNIFLKTLDLKYQMLIRRSLPSYSEEKIQRFYRLPEKPFILYLGTLEPRKNIANIIRAFEIFKKKTHSPHKLVIAGAPGWSFQDILVQAKKSLFKDSIYLSGPIFNQDRPALYKMADLFVFPSFLEGFGLPPLEAMASGTPVVCSASSSLLEIFGSYTLMANPHDIGELAWVIERGVSDSRLRKNLVTKGMAYAQNFTWEKTAKQTLAVLKSVA